MPIPLLLEMIFPLLRRCADGNECSIARLRGATADDVRMIAPDRAVPRPIGTQSRFVSGLSRATIHLERAGLIGRIGREAFTIFNAGGSVIAGNLGNSKP